jgi:hypothetical protein
MKFYLILLLVLIISYILYKKKINDNYIAINNNNNNIEKNIITSVAFIISIHPKHYEFMYKFIDLVYSTAAIDIYLVFSSEEDYQKFERKDKINKIVYEKNNSLVVYNIYTFTNSNSIVVHKKFHALEQLKNNTKYDYFIVCDAEIQIIPENFNNTNILNKINKIYENKIIYAGTDISRKKITETSANLFNNEDQNKLKDITQDFSLYYWWSDLPVYKREHLNDFFSKIDYENINWYHFDHLIYLNYLILYHNFTILNITPLINHTSSLETFVPKNEKYLDVLKNNKYGFSWVSNNFWINNTNFLMKEGTFLIYHLDRLFEEYEYFFIIIIIMIFISIIINNTKNSKI